MKSRMLVGAALLVLLKPGAWSQPAGQTDPQPIYRVTVVSRTLPAINYQHRGGPTLIDFQGTVLLPKAKGQATVESKRGRIAIDAKFEHMDAPTMYGREYLTYVLWAITPEGRPKNLGELVIDPSNKSKISVTTELQALGLMVTAEPYYAVTTPSDVVVVENVVRPDTIGNVQPVNVKYELMPRGHYTMFLNSAQSRTLPSDAEKLPYDQYEAVLELYQAQNAVQIARSLGADRFAADTLGRAETLLTRAQDMQARKQDTHMIVSTARQAAQTAEDARTIATRAKQHDDERQSRERQQQLDENQARARAEAQYQQARAQAAAEREAMERDRADAAARAEAERSQANADRQAALAQQTHLPPIEGHAVPIQPSAEQRRSRADLLARLNSQFSTRDTPRGLVATVPDALFDAGRNMLQPAASERLARIANVIAAHPGLTVAVEGYTDNRGSAAEDRDISHRRAQAVSDTLASAGVDARSLRASGMGPERPIVSNATAAGREENRRVEIVISGPGIGGMALWDRGYSLTSKH
jgi:outer membrane protein OmpA-like peptidoglycan-associated protein